MLTISMAKSPWALPFFSFTLFFTFFKWRGIPMISYGTQIYRYNKSSTYNIYNNIIYTKNKKEENKHISNLYLNLLKIFGGEENESRTKT